MEQFDLAALGNWLYSWVQPDGAIHGFHNHSVWGDNPIRWADYTSGHSTFAAPMLPALAILLETGRRYAQDLDGVRDTVRLMLGAYESAAGRGKEIPDFPKPPSYPSARSGDFAGKRVRCARRRTAGADDASPGPGYAPGRRI